MSIRRAGALATVIVTVVGAALGPVTPAGAASGSDWNIVPDVPAPDGTAAGGLRDVSALSSTDVWVVGDPGDSSDAPVTAHWDGARWTATPVPPAPTPYARYRLSAVAAPGSDDVWAVGSVRSTSPGRGAVTAALIMRHDGRGWAVVAAGRGPQPGTAAALNDVDMLTPADGWAVGSVTPGEGAAEQGLILRWRSGRWTDVPMPQIAGSAELAAVHALSDVDAWAVGSQVRAGGARTALVLHWDGGSWREISVPAGAEGAEGDRLAAVAALSPTDVWAVGRTCPTTGLSNCRPLALRFFGGGWRVVPTARDGTELVAVVPFSATDVWAVGYAVVLAQGETNHAQHWDGQRFTTELGLPPAGPVDRLGELASALNAAAAAPDTGELWAVGWSADPDGMRSRAIRRVPAK